MLVVISDHIADFGLSAFSECDAIYLCSAQPADYTAATTTLALGSKVGSRGEFFSHPAAQPNGRQVTAAPVLAGLVERAGWLSRWAAVDQSTNTLLATGPISNPQFGNPGQQFNLPSWNILFNRGLGMVDFFDLPLPLSLSRGPTTLGVPIATGNIALEPTGLTPAIPQLGVPVFRFPLQAANFKISTPLVFGKASTGQTNDLIALDLVDGTPIIITTVGTDHVFLEAVDLVDGPPAIVVDVSSNFIVDLASADLEVAAALAFSSPDLQIGFKPTISGGMPAYIQPPFEVGVYKSAQNPSDISSYESWLGRSVDRISDSVPSNDWDSFVGSDWVWFASQWAGNKSRVIISLPMIPTFGNYSTSTLIDSEVSAALSAGANGDYDSYWVQMRQNLITAGYGGNSIRLGWGMNTTQYNWRANANPIAWTAYFKRIVSILRDDPNSHFVINFNPTIGYGIIAAETVYPGDAYVDRIGLSIYDRDTSGQYPVPVDATLNEKLTRWQNVWNNDILNDPHGLTFWSAFAFGRNKPLAINELGVWPDTDLGGGDNTIFIQSMYDYAINPSSHIALMMYDDRVGIDALSDPTLYPNAASLYLSLIGRPRGFNFDTVENPAPDSFVFHVDATNSPTGYTIVSGNLNSYFAVWPDGNLRTSAGGIPSGIYTIGVTATNAYGTSSPVSFTIGVGTKKILTASSLVLSSLTITSSALKSVVNFSAANLTVSSPALPSGSFFIVRSFTAINLRVTGSIGLGTSALGRISNLVNANLSIGMPTVVPAIGGPSFASANGATPVTAANLSSGSPVFALASLTGPTPIDIIAANLAVLSPTVELQAAFTSS
jgi:hypothetical protein